MVLNKIGSIPALLDLAWERERDNEWILLSIPLTMNSAPKYFICGVLYHPMSTLIRVLTMLYWNYLFCACVFKARDSHLLVCSYCPTQCLVYSRKHGTELFGFLSQLCQFIAAVSEYLLCARHWLSMLHASFEFIPPCMGEEIGHWGSSGLKELTEGPRSEGPCQDPHQGLQTKSRDPSSTWRLMTLPPMHSYPLVLWATFRHMQEQ